MYGGEERRGGEGEVKREKKGRYEEKRERERYHEEKRGGGGDEPFPLSLLFISLLHRTTSYLEYN